ncbi:MAG: hypothetical protein Q9222_006402 [Ikaeria aurantiellina]
MDAGVVGFLNGTLKELEERKGDLVFGFGEGGRLPYGFVINKVNASYNPVEINAGPGTKGIYISAGVLKYNDPPPGGFYACNETLLYGPAVQLFYKPKPETTPSGCEDVALVVERVNG